MLSRIPQVLFKRAIQNCLFKNPNTIPTLTNFSQHLKPFSKVLSYSFSSLQQNIRSTLRQTEYQEEELPLLKDDQPEKFPERKRVMEKYLQCQDSSLLTADDIYLISENFCNLAVIHFARGDQEKGLRYLKENEEFLKKAGITDTICLANNYYLQGTFSLNNKIVTDASEHYLNEAERIAKLLGDDEEAKSLVVHCHVSLALMSELLNDQDKALELYHSVIKEADNLREEELISTMTTVFDRIGDIYHSKNDREKTMEYWTKAFEMSGRETGEDSKQRKDLLGDKIAKLLLGFPLQSKNRQEKEN